MSHFPRGKGTKTNNVIRTTYAQDFLIINSVNKPNLWPSLLLNKPCPFIVAIFHNIDKPSLSIRTKTPNFYSSGAWDCPSRMCGHSLSGSPLDHRISRSPLFFPNDKKVPALYVPISVINQVAYLVLTYIFAQQILQNRECTRERIKISKIITLQN